MFCSRCGNHVGISDVECAVCSASLNSPGAIRLIDPKLDPDFVPQILDQDEGSEGEEAAEGDDSVEGSYSHADDAEDSAVEATSLGEEIPSGEGDSDDEAETEPSEEDSVEPDQDQQEDAADEGEPAEGTADSESVAGEDSESDNEAVDVEEDDAEPEDKESRFASTRENAKAKFAVVNDRFQATFDEVRNPSTENIRAVERSLGLESERVPRQKVTAALIILFLVIAFSGVLMAQLINLDKTLLGNRPLPESTLSVAPEPSSTANRPDMDMDEGAKECDGGVWAGEHTSCELAKAAADQVKEITEPKTIKVTIGEEKQEFELSCAVDKAVTCRGTDDSQEIAVWVTR